MIIDAEVHLIQPQRRTATALAGCDEPVLRAKVFDHSDGALALARADLAALLDSMADCGIARSVIMGLPWQSSELCRENNDYIIDCCRVHPDKLRGFAVVNPPDAVFTREEIKRVAAAGLRGVKVIASWQNFRLDDACCDDCVRLMLEHDLCLLPHIDYLYTGSQAEGPHQLLRLAQRWPDLKILAPHLGGLLCLHQLHPPLRATLRNVRYITSVPTTMKMAEFAAQVCGEEQLVFGTDYPFQPNHDQRTVLAEFNTLAIPEPLQARIAGRNLQEFLNWP